MKVLKFGGSSVGSPERMKSLVKLIESEEQKIVVLSAVAGTTNALVDISNSFEKGDKNKALKIADDLYKNYLVFIEELFSSKEGLEHGKSLINYHFNFIRDFANELFTPIEGKIIL